MSRRQEQQVQSILEVDRVIHEPARLAILTVLASAEAVEFRFLERVLGLSKGNLSSHAQKLEGAGYLETLKSFRDRIPMTTFRITGEGRAALESYQAQLRKALGP